MKVLKKISLIYILSIIFIFIGGYSEVYGKTNINNRFENKKINFNKVTILDGMSQSSAQHIFQDSKGYMWIGTSDGLNRYNGHDFNIYSYKRNNDNTISSNNIKAIVEDKENNLWISTSNGLNRISLSNNNIKRYIAKREEGHISSNLIEELLVDSKGRLWICTRDGLNLYNKETDSFKRIGYEDEILSDQWTHVLEEDIYGRIWIGTKNGLNMYNEQTGEIVKKFNLSDDNICSLYADESKLWIGTVNGGVNIMNLNDFTVKVYKGEEGKENSLPSNHVTSMLKDDLGNIWIGTSDGLAKYCEEKDGFIVYKAEAHDEFSLIDNDIYNLYKDKSGTIWVGTYKGISLFNPHSPFINYTHNPNNENSISSNAISGIYEDNEGLLWIGTKDKGVNIVDSQNNKTIRINTSNKNTISSNNIRDIIGIDNEIWIATNNGLNKFDKVTKKFEHYKLEDKNSIINNNVRTLFIDNEGILWIGTNEGLCTFDRNSKIFKDYKKIFYKNNIVKKSFTDIFQDSEGIMWFVLNDNGGLIRYDKKTENIKVYKNEINNDKSLSFNTGESINEDSKGNLWIGTKHGLNKFDKKKEEFTVYTDENGLPNNNIYGVLIDAEDTIWVSTNYGISKLSVEKNRFINYSIIDGLASNEHNGYSYYKNKEGKMFFGGINGVSSFNPNDLKEEEPVPNVNISEVTTSKGNIIEFEKSINLSYNSRELYVDFFIPDYRNIRKTEYAYKLEGIDKEWFLSENKNYAKYASLPSGQYKFLVAGKNSNGIWSDITSINVNVEKAPWNTPLAYCFYIVIIGIIFYYIWNEVNLLDNLVKQRTKELNNKLYENKELYCKLIENERYKNNYFINLSHELRTPLNVILTIEQLITSLNKDNKEIDEKKLTYYMQTLRRNSKRLLNLINNIIDTSKIESGEYKLNIKKEDIVYIVEETALSMKELVESNGLNLIIDPQIEEKFIECDKEEIERCVINLIANAVKFTERGGEIYISIIELENNVQIRVKDTGIGISLEYQEAIFNRFAQAYHKASEEFGGSGLGLTLTKHLLNLHNGDIRVISEQGKGSEFIITLPITQN
ncbi:sensor histidine kinase [Clostridium tarantellae]|uniref:histidine kinase n=1 Tax=Clostridium tarantellae TaxID=39493 RepID=A0A6I1MVM5_9CLOT|nr:sensor histidine kinase [Clostridium tarantellae]MPQ44229.1 histidine kinase [Clostridium tarantellae]